MLIMFTVFGIADNDLRINANSIKFEGIISQPLLYTSNPQLVTLNP
jgi:hypothetical protein